MSEWKPCNLNDFTGGEIILKSKGYVVLQYTCRYQTLHTLNLEDHESIQKDGAVKTSISVF